MSTPTARDIDVLARTCFGEARGEGLRGMQSVCWVALNRAHIAKATGRKQFGDGSVAAACLVAKQFSCWNDDDPNRHFIEAVTLDNPVFQSAYLAALSVATGESSDLTQGATFYYADTIATPYWAEGKPYVSIGHHRFVKDA